MTGPWNNISAFGFWTTPPTLARTVFASTWVPNAVALSCAIPLVARAAPWDCAMSRRSEEFCIPCPDSFDLLCASCASLLSFAFCSCVVPPCNPALNWNTSAPNIFTLDYRNSFGRLDTVNKFNPGGLALTTLNVDYAPSGYWSAYRDSQPVAVKMDMTFTELRPIYEKDQTDDDKFSGLDSVGY